MKKILISFLLFHIPQLAAEESVSHSEITPAVAAAVEKLVVEKKLAGAVTLVGMGGEIVHLQAHGVRSVDGDDPMAVDSIFRIHSMTKAIVSAAALKLREEKKYALGDPVSKFIPAFAGTPVYSPDGKHVPAKRPITVEDLFRHTSGLAYASGVPEPLKPLYSDPALRQNDLETACNLLAKIPLVHQPGERWTYGLSIDVLGRLIEVWSGKSLDQYLQDEFFNPLEMTDTGFWIESDEDRSRFAEIHQSEKDGVNVGEDRIGLKYFERPRFLSGGGGLVSTAGDYYKFLQMIADGGTANGKKILEPESVSLMTSNRLPKEIANIAFGSQQRLGVGFGLGFSVVTAENDEWDRDAKLGEFGWGGAASCHYWVSPKDDNLIVITLEQTFPYNWNLERALKPVVYGAIKDK